jgi:hypothetical protein
MAGILDISCKHYCKKHLSASSSSAAEKTMQEIDLVVATRRNPLPSLEKVPLGPATLQYPIAGVSRQIFDM